jgi:hypothetical protein
MNIGLCDMWGACIISVTKTVVWINFIILNISVRTNYRRIIERENKMEQIITQKTQERLLPPIEIIFMCYLMTLTVLHAKWRRMIIQLASNKPGRM